MGSSAADVRPDVRIAGIKSVPARTVVLTAVASVGAGLFAVLSPFPLWLVVSAAIAPWLPIFFKETAWTRRHYGWLALFYVLAITQTAHLFEHVAQMIELHVLHQAPRVAKGVFGALDVEWVHFIWNTWVLVALALLAWRYRRNVWLLGTLAFSLWHEAEHVSMMAVYLTSGMPGPPGLLAKGGRIAGGLPVVRPDLHFVYNLIETLPLLVAFILERRAQRSANEVPHRP
jgi:hypothetical protein